MLSFLLEFVGKGSTVAPLSHLFRGLVEAEASSPGHPEAAVAEAAAEAAGRAGPAAAYRDSRTSVDPSLKPVRTLHQYS